MKHNAFFPLWLLPDIVRDVRTLDIKEFSQDAARFFQFTWQKLTRGFSDDECWSLDMTCAEWLLPRMRKLRADSMGVGYPAELTQRSWDGILSSIVEALELKLFDGERTKEQEKKYKKGMALLCKWFDSLWT
jgi:hypothetical protein